MPNNKISSTGRTKFGRNLPIFRLSRRRNLFSSTGSTKNLYFASILDEIRWAHCSVDENYISSARQMKIGYFVYWVDEITYFCNL